MNPTAKGRSSSSIPASPVARRFSASTIDLAADWMTDARPASTTAAYSSAVGSSESTANTRCESAVRVLANADARSKAAFGRPREGTTTTRSVIRARLVLRTQRPTGATGRRRHDRLGEVLRVCLYQRVVLVVLVAGDQGRRDPVVSDERGDASGDLAHLVIS